MSGFGKFFKKLFGIGATAAATVATVKVVEKYKENNPDGVKDVNEDGKVDYKDVAIEVKKAAAGVFDDTKQYVEEKNPKLAEDIRTGADKIREGADKVKDKVQDVFADVEGGASAAEAQTVCAEEDAAAAAAAEEGV